MQYNSGDDSFPFNVHDMEKIHGYIYSPKDRLYHFSDLFHVKLYQSPDCEFIPNDLRSIIDLASDTIPIASDKILIPSSKKLRLRTPNDYFTYQLDHPFCNPELVQFITLLIPDEKQRNSLKQFLFRSLTTYTPESFIIVNGDNHNELKNLLLKLDPIVKRGRKSLYCETSVNKTTLDEVNQARIVICNIENRTLRIANPRIKHRYLRPIQYHGVVFQDLPLEKAIKVSDIVTHRKFTSGEVLGWILF